MPLNFWRAMLPTKPGALRTIAHEFDPALRNAIEHGFDHAVCVELIQDDAVAERFALLISVADELDRPGRLTCWMGFSNDSAWCNRMRRQGLPSIEAQISLTGSSLAVNAAVYPVRQGGEPVSLRNQNVLQIADVQLRRAGAHAEIGVYGPAYVQFKTSPDLAFQTQEVAALETLWSPLHQGVRNPKAVPYMQVEHAAWPGLADALGANAVFTSAQCGELIDQDGILEDVLPAVQPAPPQYGPARPQLAQAPASNAPAAQPKPSRLRSPNLLGRAEFRFDDVELVGFRLTLPPEAIDELQKLVKPLNFHLDSNEAAVDFQWRVATPTVVIELLRYAKMRSDTALPPLTDEDFMSQHELLVRLLVGKVDDDGSQARDASLFISSIFVDNPWSKLVGREMQGIPKEIAEFCIHDGAQDQALDMSGALPAGGDPKPLMNVVRVRAPVRVGQGAGNALIDLRYPRPSSDEENRFQRVDLGAILAPTVFGASRWRQDDFAEREFRRSFARRAMQDGFGDFKTVQAAPVDHRGLPRTWIYGHVKLKKLRSLFPRGVAVLKLYAGERERDPTDPWGKLCKLVGEDSISLPTGDWYRLKFSMEMKIANSLDW